MSQIPSSAPLGVEGTTEAPPVVPHSLKRGRSDGGLPDEAGSRSSDEDDEPLMRGFASWKPGERASQEEGPSSKRQKVEEYAQNGIIHTPPLNGDPLPPSLPPLPDLNNEDDDDDDLPLASLSSQPTESEYPPAPPTVKGSPKLQAKRREVKPEENSPSATASPPPPKKPRRAKSTVKAPKGQQPSDVKSVKSTATSRAPLRRGLVVTEASFEPIDCWWDKEKKDNTTQWSYLEHHGLIFTPPYQPHGINVLYKGQEVSLPPQAEEVANYWCAAMDSDYGTKERFLKNFWNAFLSRLPGDHILKEEKAKFEEVDFTRIKTMLDRNREELKEKRKAMTKDEREREKARKEKEEGPFSYAMIDWLREKVGTFKTEPPTLFRGRGAHPKMGVLKRRIFPEEVTLNCHANAPVPRLPEELQGHCWKDVIHDNTVSWLAFYRDTVNGQFKYTFLGAGSAVKGQKDYNKYEKARKLKDYIDRVRQDYNEKMKSSDITDKQLGTATYMLDVLALRVGNEKDSTEEADTVGCCSLRVEHITFDDEACAITLDFLGKDSIRYLNTVKIAPVVLKNLKSFCRNKSKEEDIFDKLTPGTLNKYLKDLMPGLSAKVFRTFNASVTLQEELSKLDPSQVAIDNPEAIKQFYDSANRTVAILCNHQRSIPKQHESSMEKMKLQLHRLQMDQEELQAYVKHLKTSKSDKPFRFKASEALLKDLGAAELAVSGGAQTPDGSTATANPAPPPTPRQPVVKEGMRLDVAERRLLQVKKRLETHALRMRMKDENKTVSNSTSKQHYMDPRITVSFCKKWELPIEKLFNATLRKKFPWAMYARSDYCF